MAKRPSKTKEIPRSLRRNTQASHVRAWHTFRARNGKPKAMFSGNRGKPLTFELYKALVKDYVRLARLDLRFAQEDAIDQLRPTQQKMYNANQKTRAKLQKILTKKHEELRPVLQTGVSDPDLGFAIAKEIVEDFGRTRGLKVFGFGVGFAQLLFVLNKFMGAKTKGVDLGDVSRELVRKKGLGVLHNTSAADKSLKSLGKFDVTYSINVLEKDILNRKTALGMLNNLASMTNKGGMSYHIYHINEPVVSKTDLKKRGFRVEKWEPLDGIVGFIKLQKITD